MKDDETAIKEKNKYFRNELNDIHYQYNLYKNKRTSIHFKKAVTDMRAFGIEIANKYNDSILKEFATKSRVYFPKLIKLIHKHIKA